jgi:hypothetical protein
MKTDGEEKLVRLYDRKYFDCLGMKYELISDANIWTVS